MPTVSDAAEAKRCRASVMPVIVWGELMHVACLSGGGW